MSRLPLKQQLRLNHQTGRFVADLVIGLASLTITAAIVFTLGPQNLSPKVVGDGFFYMMTVGLLYYSGFVNVILAIVAVVLITRGSAKGRQGFVVAPFMFLALWLGASIATRFHAQSLSSNIPDQPIPSDLKTIRTLIIEVPIEDRSTIPCCGNKTLLADGHLDKLVIVSQHGGARQVYVYRLASNNQCTKDDRLTSVALGLERYDQCIHREVVDTIPDGLVVSMTFHARNPFAYGCCNEGIVSRRSNGEQEVIATWRYGVGKVLSYVPLFGFPAAAPHSIWTFGESATFQTVALGGPSFRPYDLAAAVYGIDWRTPLSPNNRAH